MAEELFHVNIHMKSGATIRGEFYRRCEWTQNGPHKQILLESTDRSTRKILVQSLDVNEIEGISYEVVTNG